jgi:hypothetical protein
LLIAKKCPKALFKKSIKKVEGEGENEGEKKHALG